MRKVLFIFSFLLFSALHAIAQNEPRFYAEATPLEVAVGEPIKVSFNLENGKNSGRFTPPDWEAAGFMALGSSQSSSISIMNGESRASASYIYTITPLEAGVWTIPSVIIKNGNGELRTEPITITATPNADGAAPALPKRSPAPNNSEPKKKIKTIKM